MRRVFALSLLWAWLLALGGAVWADNRYLVTQSTPSDCGPAALATLLHYYLDIPASEAEMVRLSKSRPQTGTSLLGLEEAATAKGCAADSFRMTWDTLQQQLASYPTPLIVRTLNPEPHFSVLFAADKDYVYLGDPAVGNIVLRKVEFMKRWLIPGAREGYVFIAAGPNAHSNEARRAQIVQGLAQQLRNLQTIRPPGPAFRR